MKRGQAFIITAVIFIAIVSTLIATHNFSKKTEFSTFPFIAEEIKIESEKVMDYALVNSEWNKIDIFKEEASNYAEKEGIKIYFIEDALGNLRCSNCNSLDENGITATIGETEYSFPKYNSGKHFYFIMIKEKGDEKYVYTNA